MCTINLLVLILFRGDSLIAQFAVMVSEAERAVHLILKEKALEEALLSKNWMQVLEIMFKMTGSHHRFPALQTERMVRLQAAILKQ